MNECMRVGIRNGSYLKNRHNQMKKKIKNMKLQNKRFFVIFLCAKKIIFKKQTKNKATQRGDKTSQRSCWGIFVFHAFDNCNPFLCKQTSTSSLASSTKHRWWLRHPSCFLYDSENNRHNNARESNDGHEGDGELNSKYFNASLDFRHRPVQTNSSRIANKYFM